MRMFLTCGLLASGLMGQPQGQGPKTEVEVVAFTPHGFSPQTITRHPGPFLLSLHNATRYPALEFSITDSVAKAVQSPVKLGSSVGHSQRSMLTLSPGTYTLRITELPAHVMKFVILAH